MRGEDAPAPGIRILLSEVPALIADLVKQTVMGQGDMKVVAEIRTADELEKAAQRGQFDVVVTSTDDSQLPMSYQRLVFGTPHIPVLAITRDGQHVDVYERHVVREVSPSELVGIIRDLAEGRARSSGH